MHHRIASVTPLPDSRLEVTFADGTVKVFDFTPLIRSWDVFAPLADPYLFKQVRVSHGGYGVEWNDDLDLSCDDLWFDGIERESAIIG